MAALFGGPKIPKVQSMSVTPRLSDAQMAAKEGASKLRSRRGIEDQILSLGKNRTPGATSMLGRVGGGASGGTGAPTPSY